MLPAVAGERVELRPPAGLAGPHFGAQPEHLENLGRWFDTYPNYYVDASSAMRPDLLARQIEKDRHNNKLPCFVAATVGTTSSTAMDPLQEIGDICNQYNIWLHVDAAMAGTAALCPEFRWILNGLEKADSYCFNPHKWMFTNFDCSLFYTRDKDLLVNTFEILPEYLKTSVGKQVNDYRDWGIQLGRRFRALKLWIVILSYGLDGIRAKFSNHICLARDFKEELENMMEEGDSVEEGAELDEDSSVFLSRYMIICD